jgi:hypothetical protein
VHRKARRTRDNHSVHWRAGRSPALPRGRMRGTREPTAVPRKGALPPRGR